MKGRVIKYSDNFWYGEIYANILGSDKWWPVTPPCYTRLGATMSLKHYLKQQKTYYIKV